MKKIPAILFMLAITVAGFTQTEKYLLVGTYNSPKSEGIYVYKFNTKTGDVSYVSKIAAGNPSYLAVSPDEKFVYAVNESGNDKGSVAAYSFNKTNGILTFIDKQPSGGDHPCYVSVHNSGKWVTVANYTGGNFSVMPVMVNGSLGKPTTVDHKGSSVVKGRQDAPHVHSTVYSPDYHYLFVADLGMDKVMAYSFNAGNGKLTPAPDPFMQTEAGTGPRHFIFHPNGKYAYLVEELSASVSAYSYVNGKLTLLQRLSALPANYTGRKWAADIHISDDGSFLYFSNRDESNTIAIFSIDKKTGKLTLKAHQSVMGRVPRNFTIDPSGNYLLVANQETDNIVIFKRNSKTGLLEDTGKRIEVGKPVCLKFADTK